MTPVEDLLHNAPLPGAWFHSIEVAPGVWTNGHKSREHMAYEMDIWRFPADLSGKTVLDIGCADGGFSAEALKRGARSVLAIDEQMTDGLRRIMAAKVFPELEFRQISLFSNAFMELPTFDFVIFAGVLYHVQDMLEALKRVRLRTAGQVLLETHVNEAQGAQPPMAVYYENDELGGDPTNWWGPNIACLEAMLRTAGFGYVRSNEMWDNKKRANGRISYLLSPSEGSVFAEVAQSPTGSNSMLEEARQTIARLSEENIHLSARLAALTDTTPEGAGATPIKVKGRWF